MSVEELFECVRVAFVPLSRLDARRGVFAVPQRGEEFVEVHGGVPFLLRCWLITSIGEDPTLARSRWAMRSPACVRYADGAFLCGPVSFFARTLYLLRRLTHTSVFLLFFVPGIRIKKHTPYRDRENPTIGYNNFFSHN